MFSLRVVWTGLLGPDGAARNDRAGLALEELGVGGSVVPLDQPLPATLELHARYLDQARPSAAPEFTLIGSLNGTVERPRGGASLFTVSPGTAITHLNPPAADEVLRETTLVFDSDDPSVPEVLCVLQLPPTGRPQGPVPPHFELTTALLVSGAPEAPVGSNAVLDIETNQLPVGPVVAARVPLVFRLLRSFPGSGALPVLRDVASRMAADTTLLAVAVGHTDGFGTEGENLQLSTDRATAAVALLTGDAAFLAQQFANGDPTTSWAELEAYEMIEAVTRQGDFAPPLIPPQDSITQYQALRGLSTSGTLDSATITRLTTDYAALVVTPPLDPTRFKALGAGTVHPARPLGVEGDPVSAIDDSPLFVHPRRVELFLFADRITPPAETYQTPPAAPDPTYDSWCTRCQSVLPAATGPLTIRLVDGAGAVLSAATVGVFLLDGTAAPEKGVPIAQGATDASGVVRFALPPGVYCVGFDTTAGSRRMFCRVNSRLENSADIAFDSGPPGQ